MGRKAPLTAIIVSSNVHTTLREAHRRAERIFGKVTGVVESASSEYASFTIPPDGTKWGKNEYLRDCFIGWMLAWKQFASREKHGGNLHWVEIQYADLYNPSPDRISRSSDIMTPLPDAAAYNDVFERVRRLGNSRSHIETASIATELINASAQSETMLEDLQKIVAQHPAGPFSLEETLDLTGRFVAYQFLTGEIDYMDAHDTLEHLEETLATPRDEKNYGFLGPELYEDICYHFGASSYREDELDQPDLIIRNRVLNTLQKA